MANEIQKQESNAVAVKEKVIYTLADMPGSLKSIIKSEAFVSAIEGFFTDKNNRQRFIQCAVNCLTKTPALANCDKMSFFSCLMQLASFGLNPDGRNAHPIPYGKTCTLVIDYKGFVTLALRCPKVSKVEAFVVHKGDHFRLVNGEVEHIVDDPWGDRGEVVGYYAVCQFSDGVKKFEVMSKAEVDGIRKRSRAGNNGPWVTDYDEMAKKTVFKRLTKWLPVTPELQDAVAKDDEEYQNDKPNQNQFDRSARVTAKDILGGKKQEKPEEETGETIDVSPEE